MYCTALLYHTLLKLQFHLTHLQREEGTMLDTKYVIMIINSISDMRAQANDLMSSLDRDKPFPYVAICGVLVQLNVFIFSTWKGVEWSIWLFSFGDDLVNQPKFWVDILVLLAWNISYMALYDLGYMLHNPFGNRYISLITPICCITPNRYMSLIWRFTTLYAA